jgi:hypothetical protein
MPMMIAVLAATSGHHHILIGVTMFRITMQRWCLLQVWALKHQDCEDAYYSVTPAQ